ncbi:MAG: hypothetical protein M1814_003688 [Vezdaea aestivalis]|nr:MAG: hypothetical protein M1814_003688 [Vezdaea aestivalis]
MDSSPAPDHPNPPKGYLPIAKIREITPGNFASCMGIVKNTPEMVYDPYKDASSKFSLSISLVDFSDEDGWVIRWFTASEKSLPTGCVAGDIMFVKTFKVWSNRRDGTIHGLSNVKTQHMIFPHRSMPEKDVPDRSRFEHTSSGAQSRLTDEHFRYMHALHHGKGQTFRSYESNALPSSKATVTTWPTQSQRLKDIKDLDGNQKFCEIIGEVVRRWEPSSDKLQIEVTDYTENETGLIYNHENNENGWTGPVGCRTIQILLWGPMAKTLKNIEPKKYVHFKNVTVTHSIIGMLDFNVHEPRNGQEWIVKKDSPVVLDPRDKDSPFYPKIIAIRHRKKDYYADHKKTLKPYDDNMVADSKQKKLTKAQQKRQNRNSKLKQAQVQHVTPSTELNQEVCTRCPQDRTYTRISKILRDSLYEAKSVDGLEYKLPFRNVHWRTKARVVDFLPDSIEDFAVPRMIEDPEDNSDGGSDAQSITSSQAEEWEWRFILVLEDPDEQPVAGKSSTRIQALVTGEDAEFLLGAQAQDLRRDDSKGVGDEDNDDFEDSITVDQLRSRLWTLWGDLEEQKEERAENDPLNQSNLTPNNLPFECCLFEAGQKIEGEDALSQWKRVWFLGDTRIKSDHVPEEDDE